MTFSDPQTEPLLRRAQQNDPAAIAELFGLHRTQLKRVIHLRLDPRLASRVDPSDVVQETLAEASTRLADYFGQSTVPFYPWLRAIAMNRLTDLYRHHVLVQKRSVRHEEPSDAQLPDDSMMHLVDRLAAPGRSPSGMAKAKEARTRVRAALEQMAPEEREVLILMYLEDMSSSEVAIVQGITERSVRRRHTRALERLGRLLGESGPE